MLRFSCNKLKFCSYSARVEARHPYLPYLNHSSYAGLCLLTQAKLSSFETSHSFSHVANLQFFGLSSVVCGYNFLIWNRAGGIYHCFGTAARTVQVNNQIFGIVETVARNEDELESCLASLNITLSIGDVANIFKLLTSRNVCGLRFFRWFRRWQPNLARNSELCSFIINNLGHLENYDIISCVLDEFKLENICLTKHAFEFILSGALEDEVLKDCTRRIIAVLRDAAGSCYASGIHALIECFCCHGFFPMAQFVMEYAGKKSSYYCVMIKERCRRNEVEAAKEILAEMKREEILHPLAFNYVISHQCKLDFREALKTFVEMKGTNCEPDALAYEIIICCLCKGGNLDAAFLLLKDMETGCIEPRLSTHCAIIKELFTLQKHEEAHAYVVDVSSRYMCSGNAVYSLLAKLHRQKGNLKVAKDIVSQMIDKGLRPEMRVYLRILRGLQTSGNASLASDLKQKFLSLNKCHHV